MDIGRCVLKDEIILVTRR